MYGIPIYSPAETDFSGNGLGLLLPTECIVTGGKQLKLVQPITDDLRWSLIANDCIIRAACPVRESPLYESEVTGGSTTVTVTRSIYRVKTNGSRLMLRQKPTTSSKILGRYKPGTEVVKLNDAGSGWFQVSVVKGGATGYMYSGWLSHVRDVTETVTSTQPPTDRQTMKVQPSRDQLFRIYSVETDTEAGMVTAQAMRIFYDLRGNIVNGDYDVKGVSAAEAAAHVFASALNPHEFSVHTPGLTGPVTGDYSYRSVVESLLDPDDGIVAQSGALFVLDNFDVFLLPDRVRDLGVTVRRGKNLNGITVNHDMADVVTRIIPVGRDKDGNPLYLEGTPYVDSAHIGQYANVYARRIEYDVSVVSKKADANPDEGKYATVSDARARLKELAEADFAAGCDLPTYGMDVDFVLLGNTDEYAEYAGLQSVHLYDTVTVIDGMVHLSAKIRVTDYEWNVLTEQYNRVTLGELQALNQTVYSYNLSDGCVKGHNVALNSLNGNSVFRDATIGYAKISVAAIEQLAADSITALTAHIGQIIAGEIEADQLYAHLATIAVAQIGTANIEKANIDWAAIKTLTAQVAEIAKAQITAANIDAANIRWADIDSLNAAVAEITEAKIGDAKITTAQISDLRAEIAKVITLAAQDGKFDFASIKDLLAGAMILEEGVAGSVYIKNLVATRANFVGATLGELILQGEDGGYYEVIVRSDGTIRTQPVTVSDGEISAGQTADGRQIVATTANVSELNASDIKAESAIISEIFAGALRAGKISAQEAFLASATIPELRVTALKSIGDTLDISANEQIRLLVTGVDAAQDEADAAMAMATANATAIEQNAKQIALRATKTELSGVAETLRGEMTVSSDAIRAEVKAISVGGANLLPESGFWQRQPTAWTSAGGGCTLTGDVTYAGGKTLYTNASAGGMQGPWVQIEPGRTYTYSAMIFSDGIDGARDRPLHFLATEDTSSTGQLVEFIEWQQAQPWHEWTLLWTTFRSTTATWFRPDVSGVDHSMYVAWLKLEEGNRPTAWTPNVEDPVRALMTSSIEILQNAIRILSGGDVSIGAGAALSIQSAATQIVTDVFNLSIGDENNRVCEFNRDTQRLSVTEVDADNVHPYINAPVTWRASEIGGIRELANRLRYCAYPSVTYIQDVDDYSASPVCFAGSLSPCVLIESDNWTSGGQRRVPPVVIQNSTGNWRMGNLTWNCAERAVSVECGVSLTMTHCWIYNANQGLTALYGGRITWENWIEHTGYCQDYMASATIGGEIKLGGYVPGGTVTPGTTGWVQNKSAAMSGTASTPATQSAALTGTLGWISAKKSWTSGLAYQGYTTGKGECYGCFQFTLPAAAASIRSATLTLRRKSGTGKGAEVDIHLYGSATAWGSRPTLGTLYASRTDAVLAGRSVSLDVTSAAQALLAGSIRQLVAYEGDGKTMTNQVYSTDYCAWDEATLDVTYTN